jgi:retinol-binding protein 3
MRTLAAAALLLLAAPALALPAGDLPAGAAVHAVDALIKGLDGYVYPDRAVQLQARLRAERPRLAKIADREALVVQLNTILAEAGDLHLKTRIDTLDPRSPQKADNGEGALVERMLAHGLMAVRRLPGNIGYLKLRYFPDDVDGARMVHQAMAMLKDTGALIIDLRENTGGGGATDERLLGHLSATPIPMDIIRWRHADGTTTTTQRRVSVPAEGPLYAAKPIFLLTANRTFSAAEAFAYALQAAHRATLVGERTRGGANPADHRVTLDAGISVFVPNGLVEHPITHGNWEGKGVIPDVPTEPRRALVEGYARALASAKPLVETPKSQKELSDAIADPEGTLRFDAGL